MASQSQADRDREARQQRFSKSSPLINALGAFSLDLDNVYQSWLNSPTDLTALRERLLRSRYRVRDCVNGRIVPPPGQTAIQFAAGVLNLVDEAWFLSQFVERIPPNANVRDASDKRILKNMHERLPEIQDELGNAVVHLTHVAALEADGRGDKKNERRDAGRPETVKEADRRPKVKKKSEI